MIKNKRAITPIISIILLLMVTIAIAGLAYTWLQRMQTTIQTTSENTSTRLLEGMNVDLKIDGYSLECNGTINGDLNLTFYVRNSGTQTANNLQLYVDNVYQPGMSTSSVSTGAKHNFTYIYDEEGVLGVAGNCTDWENVSRTVTFVSDETTAEKSIEFVCTSQNCTE